MEKHVSASGAMFGSFVIVVILTTLLLAVGIGIGLLLHWLLPGIDLGTGTLTGIITLSISVFFYSKFASFITTSGMDDFEEEIDEEDQQPIKPKLLIKVTKPANFSSKAKHKRI